MDVGCDVGSSTPDHEFRNIIFEVIINTDIKERFDTSHLFWGNFNARDKSLKKKLDFDETESIENPCQIVLAINPKEYFDIEQFND